MSYTVLARRYRSTTFDEVVGQDHVAKTLKRAIETQRIAHAFLFCGTRGTGKTSMARILAKALNCQKSDGPTTTPCGKCESCIGIARGEDMDYVEIDAASHTGVDATRGVIIDNVAYRPARGRFKIFLIDEVHMFSKSSFNALLKTLEEPPSHVKFILATTEPEKLPITILSRCQRYDFRSISPQQVAEHLASICKTEKVAADEDALLRVAKAGAGSMRDSLSLLDRLLSAGEKRVTLGLIEQLLGLPESERVLSMVQAMGEGRPQDTLSIADGLLSGGLAADTLTGTLIDHLHGLLLIRVCGADSAVVQQAGYPVAAMAQQAGQFEPATLTQDLQILEEMRRSMRTSPDPRALFDATMVRLALSEQFIQLSQILRGMTARPPAKLSTGAPATPAAAAGTAAPPPEKKKSDVTVWVAPPPPMPAPLPVTSVATVAEDEDDALPQPGRVWQDESGGLSLAEMVRRQSAPAAEAAPVLAPAEHDEADVDVLTLWAGFLQHLHGANQRFYGLLHGMKAKSLAGGTLTLTYPPAQRTTVERLERGSDRTQIAELLAASSGGRLSAAGLMIEFIADASLAEPVRAAVAASTSRPSGPRFTPPSLREATAMATQNNVRLVEQAPTRLTDEQTREAMTDPLVRAAMDVLGAQIKRIEAAT